jgi:hypothetical protein
MHPDGFRQNAALVAIFTKLKLTTKNSMLTVFATYAFIRTVIKILQQESGDNYSVQLFI